MTNLDFGTLLLEEVTERLEAQTLTPRDLMRKQKNRDAYVLDGAKARRVFSDILGGTPHPDGMGFVQAAGETWRFGISEMNRPKRGETEIAIPFDMKRRIIQQCDGKMIEELFRGLIAGAKAATMVNHPGFGLGIAVRDLPPMPDRPRWRSAGDGIEVRLTPEAWVRFVGHRKKSVVRIFCQRGEDVWSRKPGLLRIGEP